jgi:hypothetical protein
MRRIPVQHGRSKRLGEKRMNRKFLGACAATALLTLVAGCNSGPRRLQNNWNDWTNQQYSENAWMHAALTDVIPVYPVVGVFMLVGDWLVVNPYYFWGRDAWDNKGTAYVHENPDGAAKTVTGAGI